MRDWWQTLQVRERVLLAAVVIVALFVMIDSMLVETYRLKSRNLAEQLEQARDDLQWMQTAVHRLASVPAGQPRFNGRIVSYVDQQIQRHGLKDQMLQMSPIQEHSVRVRLQDVAFARLLNFLSQIDGAVIIEEARILPADSPGLVNVSLVIARGDATS
jgi:type II secretory pathway component PulM